MGCVHTNPTITAHLSSHEMDVGVALQKLENRVNIKSNELVDSNEEWVKHQEFNDTLPFGIIMKESVDSSSEPTLIADLVGGIIVPEENVRVCASEQRMMVLRHLPHGAVAGSTLRLTTEEGVILHITVPLEYVYGTEIVVPYDL